MNKYVDEKSDSVVVPTKSSNKEGSPSWRGFLMSAPGVRRVKAALSQWVRIPPGNLLQPEATGATVEVTKRFKPPVKRAANMVAARVCRP